MTRARSSGVAVPASSRKRDAAPVSAPPNDKKGAKGAKKAVLPSRSDAASPLFRLKPCASGDVRRQVFLRPMVKKDVWAVKTALGNLDSLDNKGNDCSDSPIC